MLQPEGFQVNLHVKGKKKLVCRLRKSLYGWKQAPQQWYKQFEPSMFDHGFHKTEADDCVFVKNYSKSDFLIFLLYVDDMLIVGSNTKRIFSLKNALSKSFAMKDLGPTKQILGMNISCDRKNKKLQLSQDKYIEKVLEKFNMDKAKSVSSPLASHMPYASIIGSLMYVMVCTRSGIAHAVGVVS